MKELFGSLDKVRWHNRYDKMPSLNKSLRYKLAGKETLYYFEEFINKEKMIKKYNDGILEIKKYDDEDICDIMNLIKVFEETPVPQNNLTESCLKIDKELNIIKCNYLLGNYDKMENIINIYKDLPKNGSFIDYSTHYSKYTYRLICECLLCLTNFYLIYDLNNLTFDNIIDILCLNIEILFDLIKFQELNLVKRVKTCNIIYSELMHMLFCSIDIFTKFSLKFNKLNMRSTIFSIQSLISNINLTYSDRYDLEVPIHKLILSLLLIDWFSIIEKKNNKLEFCFKFNQGVTSTTTRTATISIPSLYDEFIKECTNILEMINLSWDYKSNKVELYKYDLEFILDLIIIILSQINQHNVISMIILKYLPSHFENSLHYLMLACSFYSCCHYNYSLECCMRILEYDILDISTKNLLLNLLINILNKYDIAIKNSTKFINDEPNEHSYYLARCISYIEKSLESLSFNESQEYINLSNKDILKALELDNNDHETYFYAALVNALMDEIDTGILYCVESTRRSLFDSRPYHLMFLLLTAKGLYNEAEKILLEIEIEFPHDLNILLDRIDFEHYIYGGEVCLNTIKYALELWFSIFSFPDADTLSPLLDENKPSNISIQSDNKNIKKTMGLGLSPRSYRSFNFITEGLKINKNMIRIPMISTKENRDSVILLLSILKKYCEVCLERNDIESVNKILSDIMLIDFITPDILLISSRYHKAINEYDKCKELIDSAILIDPNNFDAIKEMTIFCLEEYFASKCQSFSSEYAPYHNLIIAEEHARRLVKIAPKNYISWEYLGKVLHEVGNHEESFYCLSRALDLESFYTLIPFRNVFKRLRPCDINNN